MPTGVLTAVQVAVAMVAMLVVSAAWSYLVENRRQHR